MSNVAQYVVNLLDGVLRPGDPDASVHPFTLYCVSLEQRSQRLRVVYPLMYLAIGCVLIASVVQFWPYLSDKWAKQFGAVLGVFSALLAFWKPDVALDRAKCADLLSGRPLAAADLQSIDAMLALPSKAFDNTVKLIGALASLAAILLLTGT